MSEACEVRPARLADADVVARLLHGLWPEGTVAEHRAEVVSILSGAPPSALPLVVFLAEAAGQVVGVIEVGLRSHADGCDGRHPVGFVEGWYVEPEHRGKDVGRALMLAAEGWARLQGCRELASDTWIDNEPSQRAHEALGFEVVDRCVHFKKSLA